jgi:hypothetical protein
MTHADVESADAPDSGVMITRVSALRAPADDL